MSAGRDWGAALAEKEAILERARQRSQDVVTLSNRLAETGTPVPELGPAVFSSAEPDDQIQAADDAYDQASARLARALRDADPDPAAAIRGLHRPDFGQLGTVRPSNPQTAAELTAARQELDACAERRWQVRADRFRAQAAANADDIQGAFAEAQAAARRIVVACQRRQRLVAAHVSDPVKPGHLRRDDLLAAGLRVGEVAAADAVIAAIEPVLRLDARCAYAAMSDLARIARETYLPAGSAVTQ